MEKNNYEKFKIVKVESDYCDYLRKFDYRVPYNAGKKDLRPFIGVLFMVKNCEYFAPLASPKPKHKNLKNSLDLLKIDKGENGIINFNNMIPVTNENYQEFDLDKKANNKEEKFRLILLQKQLRWLTQHRKEVLDKSLLLYNLYKNDKLPKNVRERCCNYPLLEQKCQEYNK